MSKTFNMDRIDAQAAWFIGAIYAAALIDFAPAGSFASYSGVFGAVLCLANFVLNFARYSRHLV